MRVKPIVIPIGFILGGAVLTAFSTPPYPLQMPSVVEHARGVPTIVAVRAWNLSPQKATISYQGDCCSLPEKIEVSPFSTKVLHFTINPERLPSHAINKVAAFKVTTGSGSFIKGVPYHLRSRKS